MRHFARILGRNRSVAVLFVLVVLLPGSILTVLVVRTVRSERVRVKYEDAQRQRHIVRLAEADLNNWLFSTDAESAISQSRLRFQLKGGQILFPEFHLSLPNAEAPRRRPFDSTPTETALTADSITDQYYPRIQAFLRDLSAGRHSGAQYFLRLRAIVVRSPGRDEGYVLDVERVVAHLNERFADFCATENFKAAVWIADAPNASPPVADAIGLEGFPFFEVISPRPKQPVSPIYASTRSRIRWFC